MEIEKSRHPLSEFFYRYRIKQKTLAKILNVSNGTITNWFTLAWQIPEEKLESLEGVRLLILDLRYPGDN